MVDEELKVFGVSDLFSGLRIAGSSVFPWVLRTHLQAPTLCCEKCAEMVLNENKKRG